jgi:hypothetical protein
MCLCFSFLSLVFVAAYYLDIITHTRATTYGNAVLLAAKYLLLVYGYDIISPTVASHPISKHVHP